MLVELFLALAIPLGLDLLMPVPEDNRPTAEKVELGRRLFSDGRLSGDGSISCASCHIPDRAFADPRTVAIGIFGRVGRRNVPAIVNRGYGRAFSWDGRAASLEEQVLRPIEDPNELGATIDGASARVGLSRTELANALASFVRSILTGNSRFDRYSHGDGSALSASEVEGLRLFRGKANCASCHVSPTFTDERFHNTGVAFGSGSTDGDEPRDPGRGGVTGRRSDRGAFKTPTLRDVVRTAPYMHDGSLPRLEDVIEFYDGGGRPNPALDPEIRPLRLTEPEKRALIEFLGALSGR